jgi:hypothetical protein
LHFDDNIWVTIKYLDLDLEQNYEANAFFSKNVTWKDKFWSNYFRPNTVLTRWEWAYFLSKVLEKNKNVFITSR